ncbi:nucleoside phosphorylase [Cytophagaceae bacterium YF14B1]|uniref:Uridine phosphorylase n=1 Tax=Xanthocytophaga flava TaxID=3048013 RepID=A0AAE3U4Q7_9BACT|nr:nucleoside phosphorylase [Xanthocytophaga flavus]MDJ1479521.1 nucleoside phosphorylase [Xanthocytophaga flavus]
MKSLAESELVLNPDGSVYHLNLSPEDISDLIIVVGDPGRVHKVTQYFDSVDFEMNKREFITQTGICNNKRVTVISTGIGTDNVEIVMNELDALVNIDLKTRQIKDKQRRLKIIRIGTSGSIQADIPVGSLVASVNAIGLDSLMYFYQFAQTPEEQAINKLLQQKLQLGFEPYCASGSQELLQQFAQDMIEGNTVTAPGFYAPQGRQLRIPSTNPKFLQELNYFHHNNFWLTNMEMETSGYYAFGRMLGHEVLSLNAILANRINNQFAKNPEKIIDDLIQKVISRL